MKVCVNLKHSSLYGGISLVVVQNGISKRQIYSLESKLSENLEIYKVFNSHRLYYQLKYKPQSSLHICIVYVYL